MGQVRVYYPNGEANVVDEAEAQRLRESKLGPQLMFEAVVSAPADNAKPLGLIGLLCDAFMAGFLASEEGFNGEHCPKEKLERLTDIAAQKVAEILEDAVKTGRL